MQIKYTFPILFFTIITVLFGSFSRLFANQADETAVLLITEFVYDPPGQDEVGEWIEIGNFGTAVVDLSDVKVGDEEMAGGKEGMRRFPEGATIAPDGVIVIAQSAEGFRNLYGHNPDYEIIDSDPNVPDMRGFPLWAGGDLMLANGGDEVILLAGNNAILDTVNYGDSSTYFAPAVPSVERGASLERLPANCDSDTAVDWLPSSLPTPGEVIIDPACSEVLVVEPTEPPKSHFMPIGAIQGQGDKSPLLDEEVTFEGVVIGVQADRNLAGAIFYTLFVQDIPGQEDGDAATSDGIAIFLGPKPSSMNIGDQVQVTGTVTEFFGFTEIDDTGLEIERIDSNMPLPEPVLIEPPADNSAQIAYFEPLEGMLVAVNGRATVVGPTYGGCGFAVVPESYGSDRVIRQRLSDPAGQIVSILHTTDVNCGRFPNVKSGDVVTGLAGPLIYNFDQFKIVQQDTDALDVSDLPFAPLPPPILAGEGQISVTTFNVENHFDGIDDTGDDSEPKPSPDEIGIKQRKLAYTLSETLGCPTLVGIQEVENGALLEDLVAETAVACGFTYDVIHRESADQRGIDVALLSQPERVKLLAADLRQGCTRINTGIKDGTADCPSGQQPLFSRPPLEVSLLVEGRPITMFINHFKSKRGGEFETASRRLAQAQHINSLIDGILAEDAQARIIVVGDFNDFDQSSTMLEMTETGQLFNALSLVPEDGRYSFVFGGVSQLIDGLLLSPELRERVTAVAIQHVNADFPDSLGLDTSPEGLPYRATDHDLPLMILDLSDESIAVPAATPTSNIVGSIPVPDEIEQVGMPNWVIWLGGIGVLVVTAVLTFLRLRK